MSKFIEMCKFVRDIKILYRWIQETKKLPRVVHSTAQDVQDQA